MPAFHTVCRSSEIPEGAARMYVVNDVLVGVFHVGGKFYALDNRCPHAGASLAGGILEDDVIRCRIHHWRFCVRDGSYLDENNSRWNARTFPVRIVGDDVQVEL